jgi:hypothetical protein
MGAPFSIAWAMRSTTNPNPPEMFFESITLMGFPHAWLIVSAALQLLK